MHVPHPAAQPLRVAFGFLLLFFFFGESYAQAQARIERISITPRADGKGHVLRIHTSARIGAFGELTQNGDELELVLPRTTIARNFQRDPGAGPVSDYRLRVESGRAVLQMQLDPARPVKASVYPDGRSSDLLVAFEYLPDLRPAQSALNGSQPAEGSKWKLDAIVIDAGHGGKDPGAVANGVREKDVTLGVALRLGAMIENELGIPVIYTRKDDRFVELHERGRIANQAGGKLFISIHVNAAANRNAAGTETYFLGLHRSEDARRVMEKENAVITLESNPEVYHDLTEDNLILHTLAQSVYLRASEQLAEKIEGQFKSRARRNSRGVKQAGFLVLWRASMPGILVELGFATNPAEAAFLKSDSGQTSLARSIFQAVAEYKVVYEKGLNVALGD